MRPARIRNLKQLLDRLGHNHFYIMHLSYAGRERRRLWEYAVRHSVVGIDWGNPDIDRRRNQVPNSKKRQLKPIWRHQFSVFSRLRIGECVVVADGHYRLLGVAMIQGPYQFKSSLDLFFRHVRKVTWLLAFEWDKRIPFWFPGFDNTLQSVDKRSQYWPIIRKALKFQRTISRTFKLQAARVEKNLKKKYGPRGEGAAHKRLKEWILDNPERIGLSDDAEGEPEYQFESGDRSDIVFRLPRNRFAVVEIETNNPEPGTFQALKYRVLKCAELGVDIKSPTVESHLVSWQLPGNTDFCRKYGIRLWRIRV